MIRHAAIGLATTLGFLLASQAQEPEAKRLRPESRSAVPPKTNAAKNAAVARVPDFKVVFWLDRAGVLKHQLYDVRKGQYTKAVDDWVNRVEFDAYGFVLPGNLATVRNIYLDHTGGRSEKEQLASAIEKAEVGLLGHTDASSVYSRPSVVPPSLATFRQGPIYSPAPLRRVPDVGQSVYTSPYTAPPPLFPVPYPYPRPHP